MEDLILAHSAKAWRALAGTGQLWTRQEVSAGCDNGSVPTLESEDTTDVWERKRILVSLRIERAGLELLHERGLDNVTVDQIASAAGISTRTFFRYFRNPRDVLNAVPLRESRRMCQALLERPAEESLLDGFHAWFGEIDHGRDPTSPTGSLETEALLLWNGIVQAAPEVIQFESRAISVLSAQLEEVLRQRLAFGPGDDEDDEKVGVLTAAFSAVIWYVYTRSLREGDAAGLLQRLDQAFDLLGHLLSAGSALTTSR
jgi:AcrR family transcriptional regulator